MKVKNIIITITAFLFAICTAFTTRNTKPEAMEDAYISVKMSPSSPWECKNSGVQCESSGFYTCRVTVYAIGGIITVNGHPNITCVTTLKHNSPTPLASSMTGVWLARD